MNIFISNDDGIKSNGLKALVKKFNKDNNVLVVAPDGNRSVCSHSMTLHKPVYLRKSNEINECEAYTVSGLPVDCVKMLAHKFTDFNADVVISGINKAHNVGPDIFYSGTVAIAYEAAFFGHIAFAFSAYSLGESPFELYADYAEKIVNALLPFSDKGTIWNVNFPDVDKVVKGVKITKLGSRTYDDAYEQVDDNGYVLKSKYVTLTDDVPDKCSSFVSDNDRDNDIYWIDKGYITITPLLFDKTNYEKIKEIKNLCIQL